MKVLMLAGGRGKRLNDITSNRNKSLIEVFEKPLIEYNLDEAVRIKPEEIIIVVGYRAQDIIQKYGDNYKGTKIKYVIQKEQKGLVNAIECSMKAIGNSDFVLMLADEIVIKSRIREMIKKFKNENLFAICGITNESNKENIGKTYSAMVNEDMRVFRLIEKPRHPINDIKGTGHCILKNEMLKYIERTPINANRGEKELVDMIQCAVDEGKPVYVFPITHAYTNVNTPEDIETVKNMIKKNHPKILIVHPQMKFFGGAELLIVKFANWLTKHGYENTILTLSTSEEVEKELVNTRLIIPKNNVDIGAVGFKDAVDVWKGIKLFRKELKKLKDEYDLINFHNFPATWGLWPIKKPTVWMLNEPPNLWSRPDAGLVLKIISKIRNEFDKLIVNSIDVICVSDEFNRKRAMQRYGKNAHIVNYGIDYDFFSKGSIMSAVKKYNLSRKFVILQSGVINKQKNQIESIKAVEKVKERIPNILLVLAGKSDESYKKMLDEYISEKNLQDYVKFAGNLKRIELRDLHLASNIGLFPIKSQGGWLAPFEFLCSGSPIIVSKEFTAAEIVRKNHLGTVSNNYAHEILNIYYNYKKYRKSSQKASIFVKENLSWDMFGKRMMRAFKEALRKHHFD